MHLIFVVTMIIWCWTYSSRSSLNWERLRNSRRTRKNVLQGSHEWINMYAAYYHMVFVHGKAAERFLKIMSIWSRLLIRLWYACGLKFEGFPRRPYCTHYVQCGVRSKLNDRYTIISLFVVLRVSKSRRRKQSLQGQTCIRNIWGRCEKNV